MLAMAPCVWRPLHRTCGSSPSPSGGPIVTCYVRACRRLTSDICATRARYRGLVNGRIKAYWLAHRVLDSKAKAYYGDIYHLPRPLGQFDTAVLGMVLGHLRDTFGALQSIVGLVEE